MRWTQRPAGSNWGDFGPDDVKGRLNLLTPARVRAAAAEIREGISFCLSLPLDYPGGTGFNPRRHPPAFGFSMRGEDPVMGFPMDRVTYGQSDCVCDDRVTLSTQYSTQWDSLAHIGAKFDADGDGHAETVYYNGFRAGKDVRGPVDYDTGAHLPPPYGAGPLGVDGLAATGFQGRGVMIDIAAHFGRDRRPIGLRELDQILRADGITVETGDILCLRSGIDEMILAANRNPPADLAQRFGAELDGSDPDLRAWITETGVAAIATDTPGGEYLPPVRPPVDGGSHFPLHELCLFKLGIPLGEMFLLSPLADWLRAHGRTRFFLTAPPLRLPGAVGSPVTPVATV